MAKVSAIPPKGSFVQGPRGGALPPTSRYVIKMPAKGIGLGDQAQHAWIDDAMIADAILDRLLSRSQRLALKGKSLRAGKQASPTSPADPVAAQHPTNEARQDPMS